MPSNIVKSPKDERLWARAKAQADSEGHAGNWKYVTAIFERMKKGGKAAKDTPMAKAARRRMAMVKDSDNDAM